MSVDFANIKTVKKLLQDNDMAPLKSLGQNFLIDHNVLNKIADAGDLSSTDLVLEIGPGLGALTQKLTERAGKVVAVEYDRGLYGLLQKTMIDVSNLQLFNNDFMQVDVARMISEESTGFDNVKVVANLPYYITTPLIFKLLESNVRWKTMVFLVQKEVAERICAVPGNKNYGALTVALNYYGTSEEVFVVSKNVFYPTPQVDSAVVRITPNWEQIQTTEYRSLQKVVQAAFGQRRKTLSNALSPLFTELGGKEYFLAEMQKLGIDPMRRGETLSVQEFSSIAKLLK